MVVGRSGRYAASPRVMYACRDEVFKTPVVTVDFMTLTLSVTTTEVTCTWDGAPTTLRGGPVSGGMFRLTGMVPHEDCPTMLTMTGTFLDERRFTGELSLAFAGFACALTSCENQRYLFTAALPP
jgi:hypothetical protein